MNEPEIQAGLAETPGYRYADLVGDQLFVAGQVPQDRAGAIVGVGDPAAQAVRCLDNLRTLLEVHGFDTDAIRRLVVYVVGERRNVLEAWAATTEWFGGEVPPATLLGVSALGYDGQLVEFDATVVRSVERQPK